MAVAFLEDRPLTWAEWELALACLILESSSVVVPVSAEQGSRSPLTCTFRMPL